MCHADAEARRSVLTVLRCATLVTTLEAQPDLPALHPDGRGGREARLRSWPLGGCFLSARYPCSGGREARLRSWPLVLPFLAWTVLQGCLSHKKHPPRTFLAWTVVLGGLLYRGTWAFGQRGRGGREARLRSWPLGACFLSARYPCSGGGEACLRSWPLDGCFLSARYPSGGGGEARLRSWALCTRMCLIDCQNKHARILPFLSPLFRR